MNEPDWKTATEEGAWRFVARHLAKGGIDTVLVGGAVAAVYSAGAYRSGDLDMHIAAYPLPRQETLDEAMGAIGFERRGGRHYAHPDCGHLFVEFIGSPLGIGDDYNITPREEMVDGVTVHILSPTDCVRDRLASYVCFEARECLDQAMLVARRQKGKIDFALIRSWARKEGSAMAAAVTELKRLVS